MTSGGVSSITDRALAQVLAPGSQAQPDVSGTEANTAGYVANTAASQPTTFVPTAGTEAGTTLAGGFVDESTVRTAAVAAGVAGQQLADQASVERTNQIVAGQQAVDPNIAAQAVAAQTPTGPPAWSEEWATKFREAGAPADLLQQLTFTGAMGYDEAQLTEALAKVVAEVEKQLAQFATEHPEHYKTLHALKDMDRGTLVQIAAGANTGELKSEQIKELVEQTKMTAGGGIGDMLIKTMLPWMLIPGWGAIRFALSPIFGGKDPISGEPIHLDFWNHGPIGWMDAAMAVGGALTVMNVVRGAIQVQTGHSYITGAAPGSDIARIAAREGVSNLQGIEKFKSFIPGTASNRAVTGIARFNADLTQGIAKMSGVEKQFAELTVAKWASGEISVLGDGAVKLTKMGVQSGVRGVFPMIGNRGKAMFQWVNEGGRTVLAIDGTLRGKSIAAHFAAAGVNLADAGTLRRLEAGILADAVATGKSMKLPPLQMLQAEILGSATKQLLDVGFISKPTGLGSIVGTLMPGPLQDALKAANQLANGTLGQASLWSRIPGPAKILGGIAAAGAGGYFLMVKPQQEAAEAAAKEAEAAAQAGGQQDGGTMEQQQAAAMQQMLQQPEVQDVVQQFLALPPEQQSQILQEENAALQEATASAQTLPAEQQQQLVQRVLMFNILVQAVQGSAVQGGGAGQQAAAQGQQGAGELASQVQEGQPAPTEGSSAGSTPTFTPAGLGLAPAG